MKIVLATHNSHKIEEFRALLAELPLEIVGYDGPEPVESGTTFVANARIKAEAAADATGLPALADDSGLSVAVMGGAPGIFSARWAGERRGDAANRELLLQQLADVPDEHRAAAFVCVLSFAHPTSASGERPRGFDVEGRWTGRILREVRGSNGFGYDPVFAPDDEDRSAAELDPAEKNARSHRALAVAALIPRLRMNVIPD